MDLIERVKDVLLARVCSFVEDYPEALDEAARAAIAEVLDALEAKANIAQRVREMIGASTSQQIALSYAEAELRAMLAQARREVGEG